MLVGDLTQCILLYFVRDLKPAWMNVQHSLIQELMLYEFKRDYNVEETAKNILFVLFNVISTYLFDLIPKPLE